MKQLSVLKSVPFACLMILIFSKYLFSNEVLSGDKYIYFNLFLLIISALSVLWMIKVKMIGKRSVAFLIAAFLFTFLIFIIQFF
jgi:hypothetical protein